MSNNENHSDINNPNIAQTSPSNNNNTSYDDRSNSRSLIDRPKSSPSTLNNLSSSRSPLTSSTSYEPTSSTSTARPQYSRANSSRPKTSYYALTWKENLDAFNKRLRRGSLSFDAFTQDEDQQQPSPQVHNNQRKESFGQSSMQDEHAPLLGDSNQSRLSYTASEQPGNSDWTIDTSASNSPGLVSLSGNGSSGDGNRHNQDNRKSGPTFPTQLNPALATTKSSKLGVFSGVFVPCVLSIWGIILFLRFGFIISQAGVIGTLGMFIVGYSVTVFTTLSLSAISTNGTVKGGGVYYLLSRSLGPEFGGSIGLIYFLCTVVGCGMNVLGFVEPLIANFGESSGTVYRVLPESWGWGFLYGSTLLISCTLVCLVGSKLFARSSLVLAVIILLSTLSIFISFAIVPPFTHPERNIEYTGFSWVTLQENLWPKFTSTSGPEGTKQSFQTVFGVLFPACIGILAGASMSGDLEDPSKAIPKGTLWAVGSTFCVYTLIVILMGGSISRSTMYSDLSVLQDVSIQPLFIAAGALAASVFAVLGGVIGAAKILQAIARDNLLPLGVFSQGTPFNDEPTLAVLFTYTLCQLCLFLTDMNAIATFVSLITLLTFLILNLACFLLKIGSAPNFRPSFKFFHWWTAFGGMVLCAIVMGFVDLGQSLLSGLMIAVLFIWIHYWSPPKRWGDVTQSLIYHQVRKYLLRLDSRKEHVKFWRPQILLLVHHPRSEYQLIQFCNHLKKGALYVLGHVILGDLRDVLVEYRRQQGSWLKFVDVTQIKAFVNLSVADNVRIGARNLLIGSGLGGMRPNIVVLGSFNLQKYLKEKEERDQEQHSRQGGIPQTHQHPLKSAFIPAPVSSDQQEDHTLLNIPVALPIDNIRVEASIKITDYVSIIEDVLSLNKAVAIGYGFDRLELPEEHKSSWRSLVHNVVPSSILPQSTSRSSSLPKLGEIKKKKYIDLWPMQMSITPQHFEQSFPSNKRASRDLGSSSPIIPGHGSFPESYGSASGVFNANPKIPDGNLTNFDTYAMVLQMGCILHMVPQWKDSYVLRVMVFVEYIEDVEEERKRLYDLLENLRIPAEVKVMCLDGGDRDGSDSQSPSFVQTNSWIAEPEKLVDDPEEDESSSPIAPVAQRSGPRNINPHWKEHALLEEDEEGEESSHQVNIQEDGQYSSHESGSYSNKLAKSRENSPSPSRHVTGKTNNMPSIEGSQGSTLPPRRRTISHPSNPQYPQRNQSPSNLRVNTRLSPRPRQGSPLGASFANTSSPQFYPGGSNIPRHRNTLAGSTSPMETRLGTSVPLGASMNFRIAVPLPRQYFDPNGLNSSESESDSISSEDDEEYDRNDDDLAFGGLYPQHAQDQQQRQRLAHLSSPTTTRFPNKQMAGSITIQPATLPPSPQLQQPLQQAPIGQQHTKSSALAHTSIGSERGLGIALGDSPVSAEQRHPLSPSASARRPWMSPADSEETSNFGNNDVNKHQSALGVSQEPQSIYSVSPGRDIKLNQTHSYNDWIQHDPESLRTPSNFAIPQEGSFGPPLQVPLQFDHLSPEAQLMIMNELMRIHSSSETTSIVFTTVPAPEIGTCLHEQSSVAYLEKIDLLMDGIDVPVLLLHAKSLTVTMTL
ncbi:hypothetical protein BGZ76_005622 [Entomortierella beljakovae]|nr:hypothetical protein BGZ76_005622 [Entomortierella beljakovae]